MSNDDAYNAINEKIQQFQLYRESHPNLANCWLAYLELKKRHYDSSLLDQCDNVLSALANGFADLLQRDIIILFFFIKCN